MAKFYRLTVLDEMVKSGFVPLYFNQDTNTVKNVVSACYKGGSKIFEFTNRGDGAFRVFTELNDFVNENHPEMILGVGSVLDAGTASQYISAGANFIVGSVMNADVAKICNRRKISYLPGCGTASEISEAEESGAEIIKVFPGAAAGGPGFVKAVLGPTPWSRLMVTGGVKADPENLKQWFDAGVTAVGIGSDLIKKEYVNSGNFDEIATLTYKVRNWINAAKNTPLFLGIEHVGLYPTNKISFNEVEKWYRDIFDFNRHEGKSSVFLSQNEFGRIEIPKKESEEKVHIAIGVSDFEKCLEVLAAKGVELETPVQKEDVKAVFLKKRDPLGNRVHLIWRR